MSKLLIRCVSVFFLLAIFPLRLSSQSIQANKPIPVKVVVVAMFERGEDTGDTPGEYQLWVEREHLDQILPLPAGYHHVRLNKDGVLGILTGVGTAKAVASVMAVGLDPRFDLSKAYWLVAGIGGGDPADVSLGSAVWAEHVLDGDLAYQIDARQVPENWPTGYIPLRKATPYEEPVRKELEGEAYSLNPTLVDWAFRLTKDVPLPDSDSLRASRARSVLGDVLGSCFCASCFATSAAISQPTQGGDCHSSRDRPRRATRGCDRVIPSLESGALRVAT